MCGLLQSISDIASVDAFIVVFSVTDESSFLFASSSVQFIHRRLSKVARSSTAIILVANKNDLVRNRVITDYGNRFRSFRRPVQLCKFLFLFMFLKFFFVFYTCMILYFSCILLMFYDTAYNFFVHSVRFIGFWPTVLQCCWLARLR